MGVGSGRVLEVVDGWGTDCVWGRCGRVVCEVGCVVSVEAYVLCVWEEEVTRRSASRREVLSRVIIDRTLFSSKYAGQVGVDGG